MAEEQELTEYELAIGGTRPALMPYLNMPWIDFVIFLMAGVECVVSRWELLILLAVPFFTSLLLYRKDYNAGRCFLCWLTTSGRHLSASTFGGTFMSPTPAHVSRIYRGILPDGS